MRNYLKKDKVTYKCFCCEVPCEVTHGTDRDIDSATGEHEEGLFIGLNFLCREGKFVKVG